MDLEAAFLRCRPDLLIFLSRLGAGDAAEDILHELWLKLPSEPGPIHAPRSYLYRMANRAFIDWTRSRKRARQRDAEWTEVTGPAVAGRAEQPDADRILESRQLAAQAMAAIERLGQRVALVFTRHRLDGLTQKQVARELGISVATVEGDLRRAYRALADLRHDFSKV